MTFLIKPDIDDTLGLRWFTYPQKGIKLYLQNFDVLYHSKSTSENINCSF